MRLICSSQTESGERGQRNHKIDLWFRKSPEVRQDGVEAHRNRDFRTSQWCAIRSLDQSRLSVDMQQLHLQCSAASPSTHYSVPLHWAPIVILHRGQLDPACGLRLVKSIARETATAIHYDYAMSASIPSLCNRSSQSTKA